MRNLKTRKTFSGPTVDTIKDVETRDVLNKFFSGMRELQQQIYDDLNALVTVYAFSVHKGGTNQIAIVTATYTKLTWSTEEYDDKEVFASSKFTPGALGKYLLIAAARWTAAVDQTAIEIAIYKNGVIYKSVVDETSGTGEHTSFINIPVEADTLGDYFEVYVKQSSGADKIVDGAASKTFFQGLRVGF